ncbi:hypothetical protein GGR52DRAFT_585959 [Hypoxylon sp. FL1284]|nr:hypothetical protein GGR52DRAFT_585959 [Hypoxylon sp. FL1284]
MSIFLDFDGTITAEDTVGELANFALGVRAAEGQDLGPAWAGVAAAYVGDRAAHVDAYRPRAADRSRPEQEVDFLRRLKDLETRSLARVADLGLFRGLGTPALRDAGRDRVRAGAVRLRPGFRRFAQARRAQGWRVWVLSVNWSAAFIEGACCAGDGDGDGQPLDGGLRVIANEVRDDGSVAGPAVLNPDASAAAEPRNLTNSLDKLDAMRAVLAAEGLAGMPSVYFGDSTTDLECLLAADRGFVVADKDDSSLLRTLRRIGKDVPHVRDRGPAHTLAWTSDYENFLDDMFSLG